MSVKKWFPYSAKVEDVSTLIITLIVYAVVTVIANVLFSLLGHLFLVGWAFNIIGYLVGLYCGAGAIIAILVFFKVI